MNKKILGLACAIIFSGTAGSALAGVIPTVWNGWTQIAAEDQTVNFTRFGPTEGWGGQAFDAEYLYFQQQGNTVSFGLQTGFDVVDGHQTHSNDNYWAGDMVLRFGAQEFAIDFGLEQCGYSALSDASCGTGNKQNLQAAAGVYSVSDWNNDIYFTDSGPFSMAIGTLLSSIVTQAGSATIAGELSYYRTVSFDLAALGPLATNDFDLRWTMSCGNDLIAGTGEVTDVPEPSSLVLMGLGLLGLGLMRRRMKA